MSVLESIEKQLQKRFAEPGPRGRVVVWTDPEGEYDAQVDLLDLPGVTVLHVADNEFDIKRQVYGNPKDRFLVYRGTQIPANPEENWLLDLDCAYEPFTTDRASLVAQEVGGGAALRQVAQKYPAFFKASKRNEALKKRLSADDDETDIMAKMIAVLIGCDEHNLSTIWRNLLTENAEGKSTAIDEIAKFGLADFHWQGTHAIYGYASDEPSVDDFVWWLFSRAWNGFASKTPNEFGNIQRDFSTWSNDVRFTESYRRLADRAAEELGIGEQASHLDLADLASRFTFKEVDQQIISRLARGVEDRTLVDTDVQSMVRRRSAGQTWYLQFRHHYEAISAASTALTSIDALDLDLATPAEGVRRYTEQWYAIDQAYRLFMWNIGRMESAGVLDSLRDTVEAFYMTHYVKPLGDTWQRQIDTLDQWRISGVAGQTGFFTERVKKPFLDKGQKIVVVISDGLRYEVGEELSRRIREADRFTTDLIYMLSTFPSYTQLGMAALLPHETLSFADGNKAFVQINGGPSDGTKNRTAILSRFDGSAIQATDFMKLNLADAREFIKANRVVYIYHNQIDKAGDTASTETTVFRETESAINELVLLMKKLTNANVNNMLITSDHGFLYQETPLDESEYLSVKAHGDELLFINHRFVLGRDLKRTDSFTTFTSQQLSMSGDMEAQVPKSIHRIRIPGSGVRYVHGGTALQEIVVPVIAVNKKRTSDSRKVAVKIMTDTNRISTSQVTVTLYQEEPVTEKVQARTLIAGLYAGETLISNEVTVVCSATSTEPRDRYNPVILVLAREADGFDGQTAELRLAEPVGTGERRPYPNTARFTLTPRTFERDFDFDF